MQDHIEALAEFSVGRGCAFAMLAITVAMVGFSFDSVYALKVGAGLALITSLTLLLRAVYAEHKPYKSTELWVLLKPDERPPASAAQQVLSRALKRAYLRFALYFASGTAGLTTLALVVLFLSPGRAA